MKREHFKKVWFRKVRNERGAVLAITYMVLVVFLFLGTAFLVTTINEAKFAERQMMAVQAFYIAEAGIERAIYDLRTDYLDDVSAPSWADGDINSMVIGPDEVDYYEADYDDNDLNGGTYDVEFLNVGTDKMWIRSTGSLGDVDQTILVYVEIVNVSPWNNAIFAGAGAAGQAVNGNVNIRGSVHILGTGLDSTDLAIDLGGTAELVGNNYNSLAAGLQAKVPALPTTTVDGVVVSTLNAELRVKAGQVALSGSSTVGEANDGGNTVKELVDAAYVTDGYDGDKGAANVFSDNGTTAAYDLGDAVDFPSLSDPAPADPSITYQEYLYDNALVIDDAAALAELAAITPASNFSYSDGNGSISIDGNGNMEISGIVYVDGGAINMSADGADKTITYTGSGSLLVEGNVQININVVTDDYIVAGSQQPSYPTRGGVPNALGIMTPGAIGFNGANIDVMGLLYAENSVVVEKQTDILGTIVANYFDMGTNVPSIFQVPETTNYLPPGMIGGDSGQYLRVVSWQKIPS